MRPILTLSIFTPLLALAQAGTLDPAFGTGGIVTTDIQSHQDDLEAVAVQADGRIVAAGGTYDVGAGIGSISVVRYNADGTLDGSFGSGGEVITSTGAAYEQALDVELQTDGRIIVAGSSDSRIILVRYMPDGSLDHSFDGDGIYLNTTWAGSMGYCLKLQPDGKILVGGVLNATGAFLRACIWRFNSDGSLDASFADAGYQAMDFPGDFERFYGLALQGDGRIVAVGSTGNTMMDEGLCVARLNSDGSPDGLFSGDGKYNTTIGSGAQLLSDLVVDEDEKITAVGCTPSGGVGRMTVIQLLSDGTWDDAFNGDGKFISAYGYEDWGHAIVREADGRVVIGGACTLSGSDLHYSVTRLNTDGTLDPAFDGDGVAIALAPGGIGQSTCMALDGQGRIVQGGWSQPISGPDHTLMRWLNDQGNGVQEGLWGPGDLHCSPNPARSGEMVTCSFGNATPQEKTLLTLTDMAGKSSRGVQPVRAVAGWSLPVQGLVPGMYMLRTSGSTLGTCRLLIAE